MALISCPECKKDISDQAECCPDCGFLIQNPETNNNLNQKAIDFFSEDQKDVLDADLLAELSRMHSAYTFFILGALAFALALGEIRTMNAIVIGVSFFALCIPCAFYHARSKNGIKIKELTLQKGIGYNYITKITALLFLGVFLYSIFVAFSVMIDGVYFENIPASVFMISLCVMGLLLSILSYVMIEKLKEKYRSQNE